MLDRIQRFHGRGGQSAFLWGPRQTGKSTLVRRVFGDAAPRYDLLLSEEFERLNRRPSLLREEVRARPPAPGTPVIVDEVQKVPALLDEVHWLIENMGVSFILCGSSPRKLRRGGGNLLGGRALRYDLYPLVSREIPDFDLLRALNHGLLPRHYLARDAARMLRAYVGDYLREEVAAEGLTRNLPAFGRFLEVAAFSNGHHVNYQSVARECGVSAPTAREYFRVLEDTLVARFVPAFRRRPKRRVIESPRFYFFDVGVVNFLLRRGRIVPRSEVFGRAFEHFIFGELAAHAHYSGTEYDIAYWRTASGLEVDFVLGAAEAAIEVKGVEEVASHHLRGLRAFLEEYRVRRAIVVSLDARPRAADGIEILPYREFLARLWGGAIVGGSA